MKKLSTIALLAFLCLFVGTASADDATIGGVIYSLNDDSTASIAAGTGIRYPGQTATGDVVIPETITVSITGDTSTYTVTSIGDYAWSGKTELTSITIPATVTTIGVDAFYHSGLTSVTFADGSQLTTIGDKAFYYCESLASVTCYATTPPTLGTDVFANTSSKLVVYVPAGCKETYEAADNWSSCTIKEISTSGDDEGESTVEIGDIIHDSNGVAYSITSLEPAEVEVAAQSDNKGITEGAISIPETVTVTSDDEEEVTYTVTSIAEKAWYSATIESVSIPSTVKQIGDKAFQGCKSLAKVTFDGDSQLTSLSLNMFYGCTSLAEITIPESVTTIGYAAFYNCSLTEIIIPGEVETIQEFAFGSCSLLTTVYCYAETPPTLVSANAFYKTSDDLVIYVPAGCKETYEAADNWSSCTIKEIEADLAYSYDPDPNAEDGIETLETITITCTRTIKLSETEGLAITLQSKGNVMEDITAACEAGEDGYSMVITLSKEITDACYYYVEIPAGYFLIGNDEEASEAIELLFTVGDVDTDIHMTDPLEGSTLPAGSEVSTLTFERNGWMNWLSKAKSPEFSKTDIAIYVTTPSGEEVLLYGSGTGSGNGSSGWKYRPTVVSNTYNYYIAKLFKTLTESGEYTVHIDAGVFQLDENETLPNHLNSEMEFTFTIEASEEEEEEEEEESAIVEITPEAGEVKTLSAIKFAHDPIDIIRQNVDENDSIVNLNESDIKLYAEDKTTVVAQGEKDCWEDWDSDLYEYADPNDKYSSNVIGLTLPLVPADGSTEITEPGTYYLYVPAGIFDLVGEGDPTSDEIWVEYTIAESSQEGDDDEEGGTETGISAINAAIADGAEVYNLAGQKVNAPVKGNVYIIKSTGSVKKMLVK